MESVLWNVYLKYLIQENNVVPAAAAPLANGMPHLIVRGSIIADFESRLSHTHAMLQLDNAMIFVSLDLDKAVRDSEFSNTIKPFERARDDRGAYLANMGNHIRYD